MVRVGIVGATGLVGQYLVRVLLGHPEVRLTVLCSDHAAGEQLGQVCPALKDVIYATLVRPDVDALAKDTDIVFMAKKGPEAMKMAPPLVEAGVKAVDMGGAFRFGDPAVYERWYREEHLCPGLLKDAVYGLPETHRDEIRTAEIIGNPGCYPTGAILPLVPLLAKGIVRPDGIIIDSFSGISGAGATYSAASRNLFLQCNENCRAYSVATHRHAPEMEQELSAAAGTDVKVVFVPHLLPLDRGLLTNVFAPLNGDYAVQDVLEAAREHYEGEPFVRLFDDVSQVELLHVARTNFCDIGYAVDLRAQTLIAVSAIDNVIKGSVGLAVQSLNLLFGLDETLGLKHRAL